MSVLVWLMLAVGSVCLAGPPPPLTPPPVIKVVMDNNYPPFAFKDSEGHLQGILIDQWRLWEQKTGIRAEIHGYDWDEARRRMEAGEFDVIDTIFFTERRSRIYDFSPPYYTIDVPVFFHRNISGINNATSLRGFAVAVKTGDAVIDVLKQQGVSQLVEFNSYEAIIDAARDQKVVVFAVDRPPALYYLYKKGIYDQFRQSPPLYSGKFHRAVKKGNTALLKMVEQGFARISPTELKSIEQKWYGTPPFGTTYPKYLVAAAAAAVGLVVLLAIWTFTLRRVVAGKTAELVREIALSNRRAEELQLSEERFQAIFDSVNDAIFIHDLETGDILDVNRRMCEMSGYSRQEACSIGVEALSSGVPPYTRKEAIEWMRKAAQGDPQQFEWHSKDRNGRLFWIEVNMRRARIGGQDRILVTARDISGRRRAEEALRASEEKYRNIFEYAPIGIFQSTVEGRFLYVNSTLAQLYAYDSPEEIIAAVKDIPGQIFVRPEQRSDLIGRALASDGFVRGEVDYRRSDGSLFIANLHIRVVRGYKGDVAFLEGFVEDITERKRAEDAFHAQFVQISTIFDELSVIVYVVDAATGKLIALNKYGTAIFGAGWQGKPCHDVIHCGAPSPCVFPAGEEPGTQQTFAYKNTLTGRWYQCVRKEIAWVDGRRVHIAVTSDITDLKEMVRMKDELLSIVSHEIRSPLTAMRGYTEFLLENSVDEAELRQYLGIIQSENMRLDELLTNLLDLKNLKAIVPLDGMTPLALGPLLEEAAALFAKRDSRHRILKQISPDLSPVPISAGYMHRVLVNLLSNAVKYSPKGGDVILGAQRNGAESVTIWVRDEGVGMPPEVLDKIFDRFYQVDSSDRRVFSGTGLGLALVKEIVSGCGGRVWVESTLGEGSTFFVSLPAAREGEQVRTEHAG
ncbi:PAS domain S-box protein [Geobacter sp. AOG1]|uniref:PAS domain S-box protein n=1 Tax=Geobacter sp. AOG1 TaxID=1566346 RepID=UPI001CC7B6F5|nr:PAS domain S-box protein [Geobacter sp. AOG1]